MQEWNYSGIFIDKYSVQLYKCMCVCVCMFNQIYSNRLIPVGNLNWANTFTSFTPFPSPIPALSFLSLSLFSNIFYHSFQFNSFNSFISSVFYRFFSSSANFSPIFWSFSGSLIHTCFRFVSVQPSHPSKKKNKIKQPNNNNNNSNLPSPPRNFNVRKYIKILVVLQTEIVHRICTVSTVWLKQKLFLYRGKGRKKNIERVSQGAKLG